jgi:hypothetical protein
MWMSSPDTRATRKKTIHIETEFVLAFVESHVDSPLCIIVIMVAYMFSFFLRDRMAAIKR